MRNPKLRLQVDATLLLLAVLLALAIAVPPLQPARPVLALVACAVLPGAGLLTLIPVRDFFTWCLVAVLASLAIGTVTSLATLWLDVWHPLTLAGVLGAASFILLGIDLWRVLRSTGDAPRGLGRVRRRTSSQPSPAQH